MSKRPSHRFCQQFASRTDFAQVLHLQLQSGRLRLNCFLRAALAVIGKEVIRSRLGVYFYVFMYSTLILILATVLQKVSRLLVPKRYDFV